MAILKALNLVPGSFTSLYFTDIAGLIQFALFISLSFEIKAWEESLCNYADYRLQHTDLTLLSSHLHSLLCLAIRLCFLNL